MITDMPIKKSLAATVTETVTDFEEAILIYSNIGGEITCINRLVLYLKCNKEIVGLDKWAHDQNLNPWWVRHCAHQAKAKGLITMTRLTNTQGQPYRVTLQEETNEK